MRFFLLFLLLPLNSLLFSQTYFPFPENSATWIVREENPDGGSGSCIHLYDYQITGDTIINLLTYHKLSIINYGLTGSTCGSTLPPYFGAGYIGSLRNDTLSKKVFIFYKDSIQETLLYDFNLTSGDTIKGFLQDFSIPATSTKNNAIIDSIDSVIINGNYRKRWNYTSNCSPTPCFHPLFNGSYIEGIGNINGLLEGLASEINIRYNLLCFQENGIPLYEDLINSDGAGCSIAVSTQYFLNNTSNNIYPNPAKDMITIQINETTFTNSTFKLIDVMGKEVVNKRIESNTTSIDISQYTKGMYFYQLINHKERISGKLIIQ